MFCWWQLILLVLSFGRIVFKCFWRRENLMLASLTIVSPPCGIVWVARQKPQGFSPLPRNDKYFFAIWTNTFGNLDKYILHFWPNIFEAVRIWCWLHWPLFLPLVALCGFPDKNPRAFLRYLKMINLFCCNLDKHIWKLKQINFAFFWVYQGLFG